MTAAAPNEARPALVASNGVRTARRALARISATAGLGLFLWCGSARALLPPVSQTELDAHVMVEGTVVAITHTDEDLDPEPRELGGRRRLIRTFALKVRLEKAVKGRDPAAALPPSGAAVLIHGTELIGPATEGGVDQIDELRKGARARFYLERHDDGAWFILAPNGLVPMDVP